MATRLSERGDEGARALAVAWALVACASLFAVALAVPLALAAQRRPARWVVLVGAGALCGLFMWRPFVEEVSAGWASLAEVGLVVDPAAALDAAWPHVWRWWLWGTPLAPACAAMFELGRARSVVASEDRRERVQRRRTERAARAATRRATRMAEHGPRSPGDSRGEPLVWLGAHADGDGLLVRGRRGEVAMPAEWLRRHVLVIGPSGSGKTETLLRLAYGAARLGWIVYYVDAKGDQVTADRFVAALRLADVEPAVFPVAALDGWRGDERAIYNRLIELVAYASEGDGAYYRDVAKRALWLACTQESGPPRSSEELLERLKPASLRETDAGQALASADAHALGGVELRYGAFFAALGGALDGRLSFEDARSIYFVLDGLRLREEAQSLARFLVEDFADFAVARKPRERPALLIVDEYSAVAEAGRVVELVERLRSYNVGVVLAPQVEAGMGGHEASDRVVQNAETVFLHALKRPEGIVSLAGTRWRLETSYQHEREQLTGMASSRAQHQFRVDPNEVRTLAPGECFVIRRGRAERIKVARAPASRAEPVAGAGLDVRRPVVSTVTQPAKPVPRL